MQNEFDSSDFELFVDSKIERDNELFVVAQKSSEVDIVAITKTISCKKRNLKKQRNKKWKIKKQQFEFASFSKLNSNDSMNICQMYEV